MAAPKGLQWLVKVNDFLETVPKGVLKYLRALVKSAEEMSQAQVDIACAWIAWKVNTKVEGVRQRVIKTLYEQYGSVLALMKASSIVQRAVTDPIGAIGGFIGEFAKPITLIISWVTTLMKEIPRLAKNLAEIATMRPPEPPNPNINFNAFPSNLKINTITIQDIIMGPNGMPSPEEMFPEPLKPFSRENFNKAFDSVPSPEDEAVQNLEYNAEKIVYKLKNRDTEGHILEEAQVIGLGDEIKYQTGSGIITSEE